MEGALSNETSIIVLNNSDILLKLVRIFRGNSFLVLVCKQIPIFPVVTLLILVRKCFPFLLFILKGPKYKSHYVPKH